MVLRIFVVVGGLAGLACGGRLSGLARRLPRGLWLCIASFLVQGAAAWMPVQALARLAPLPVWQVGVAGWHPSHGETYRLQWRYFALIGSVSTLMIFLLGFFTDVDRISFHWPLPGYFALLAAAPVVMNRWSRGWRRVTWGMAAAGLVLAATQSR